MKTGKLRLSIITALILNLLSAFSGFSLNAPVTTIANVAACPASIASFPVTVDGFTSIGAFTLRIEYDPAVLTYSSAVFHPSILGAYINSSPVGLPSTLYKIMISWSPFTGVTLPTGAILVTLNFNYINGNSALAFNNTSNGGGDCEYSTPSAVPLNDLPTSTYYHDGQVSSIAVPAAGTITGPATVCQSTNGAVYSITPLPNATTYLWTVPPGATIVSGSTTNQITVNYGSSATSGNVCVQGQNTCNTGASSCLSVTVNPSLPVSVSITASANPFCQGTSVTFLATPVNGGSSPAYQWKVNGGNVGTGTNTYTYFPANNDVVVCILTSNATCASGNPATSNSITMILNPLPGPAGNIVGTPSVCAGASGIPYSVGPIPNAVTYVWTLPAGAVIATGAGTNAITVNFAANASSGNITVYGNNLCGNGNSSPPFPVTVDLLPGTAGNISGDTAVCQSSSSVNYSVNPVPNATGYSWSLPSGAIIVAGNNTNNITVDFSQNAVSGDIAVAGTNSCGTGPSSPNHHVTVNATPPAPVITSIFDTLLVSNMPTGNQWYLDGNPVPGATGQTLQVSEMGDYFDIVTINGCASNSSNLITIITGIDPVESKPVFQIYPTPNDGLFTLSFFFQQKEKIWIELFSLIGEKVFESREMEVNGNDKKIFDLRLLPEGMYLLIVKNRYHSWTSKLMIDK